MMRCAFSLTERHAGSMIAIPVAAFAEPPQADFQAIPEAPDIPAQVKSGKTMEPDRTVMPETIREASEPPMPVDNGETIEPDITIIRKGKNTIQEYRINAKLYMIKIIPAAGPPYYLIDTDGDGNMDVRGSDLERGVNINQWKILEWK